jgi:hypothetical protein
MFSWCECAATCAIVRSIAARVAPNPTWSSPEPAWQSAEPQESATTYENEGDDVAEDDDAQDAPSTAADGDQAVSTAAASFAPTGKTCAAVCRRFSDCKLFTFEPSVKEWSSCSSLAAAMASSQRLSIAEGASVHGHDVESVPPSGVQGTSSVYLAGQGKTRADAEYSAISDYNAMMTVDLTRNRAMNQEPSNEGSWESAVPSPCHVTRFYAPARARRGKSASR